MVWCGLVGLAQDRDKWRTLVDVIMNLQMLGKCQLATQLIAFQVVLSSIELIS
jgi:hypothetical protein